MRVTCVLTLKGRRPGWSLFGAMAAERFTVGLSLSLQLCVGLLSAILTFGCFAMVRISCNASGQLGAPCCALTPLNRGSLLSVSAIYVVRLLDDQSCRSEI